MNGHAPSNSLVPDQDLYASILQLAQPAGFHVPARNGQASSTGPHGLDLQQFLGGVNRGLSNDAPWNPLRATASTQAVGYKPKQPGFYQNYVDYRNPTTASDCEDSGYQSMGHSVIDPSVHGDQDRGTETQSLFGGAKFEGLQLQSHGGLDTISLEGGYPQSRWPPRSTVNLDARSLWCETCHSAVKTKAELK